MQTWHTIMQSKNKLNYTKIKKMPKLSAKNSAIKQYITLGSSVGNFLVTRSKITKFQTQIRDKIVL